MYKAKKKNVYFVCINVSGYEFYWGGYIHLLSFAIEISLFNILRSLIRNLDNTYTHTQSRQLNFSFCLRLDHKQIPLPIALVIKTTHIFTLNNTDLEIISFSPL